MIFKHFTAADDDENRRLERVLRKFLSDVPLGLIHKSMRSGFIKVNGLKKNASYRVQKGDVLDIADFLADARIRTPVHNDEKAAPPSRPDSVYAPFTDVFANEHIRIVNKAYGVPVHGGSSHAVPLDKLIRREYAEKAASDNEKLRSLSFVPGPLHRIDRRTTGLVAFSQSLIGAQYFSKALAEGRIGKIYTALLQGTLDQACVWENVIEKKGFSPARAEKAFATVKVKPPDKGENAHTEGARSGGKTALTAVQPLAHGKIGGKNFTLVSVKIKTGKTHQIRAQAAFAGFPLLGDSAYGADFFSYPDKYGQSLFLHARTLIFEKDNPLGIPEKISAPLPSFFAQLIKTYLPAFELSTYTKSNESS